MVCIISAGGGIVLLSNFKRTISKFCIGMIIISVITGIYIRPISKGLDTIYEKPVAQQIEKITKKIQMLNGLLSAGQETLLL